MDFGERLKQLRSDRDWTQPEASSEIGVEQSYLSKLENGAIPSSEVFRRILDTYNISVGDVLDHLDDKSVNQLRRISEVDQHVTDRATADHSRTKRYIQSLIVAAALGAALVYAGTAQLFFPTTAYTYTGIAAGGMSADTDSPPPLLSYEFRGTTFTLPGETGVITYTLSDTRDVERWHNKLILFIGVFLLTGGMLALLAAGARRGRT